jgi:hypothetical protein
MWHEKKDEKTGISAEGDNPAFEIVSGIDKLKIKKIKKEKGYYIIEGEA